jgi:hypothetical protein
MPSKSSKLFSPSIRSKIQLLQIWSRGRLADKDRWQLLKDLMIRTRGLGIRRILGRVQSQFDRLWVVNVVSTPCRLSTRGVSLRSLAEIHIVRRSPGSWDDPERSPREDWRKDWREDWDSRYEFKLCAWQWTDSRDLPSRPKSF